MKKNLMTGLVLILPVFLTIYVLLFFLQAITSPFLDWTQQWIAQRFSLHPFKETLWFVFFTQCVIVTLLFFSIVWIGWIGQFLFFHYTFSLGDRLVEKLPVVNTIYRTSREITNTVFSSPSNQFTDVVFIPFPSLDAYGIGLVAQKNIRLKEAQDSSEPLFSVFVSQAPNPSGGFVLVSSPEKLLFTDMKVHEALKAIFSCGAIFPEFKMIESTTLK